MVELALAFVGLVIAVATLVFTSQGREVVENVRYHFRRLGRVLSARVHRRIHDKPLDFGDRSTFVADTTIPNDTKVAVGSRFKKTWEIRNVGSVVWEDRFLQRLGPPDGPGRLKCALRSRVQYTEPGQTCHVSVWLTAPSLPTSCYEEWKMVDSTGRILLPNQKPLNIAVDVVESL